MFSATILKKPSAPSYYEGSHGYELRIRRKRERRCWPKVIPDKAGPIETKKMKPCGWVVGFAPVRLGCP
jgi:hypothetical protein